MLDVVHRLDVQHAQEEFGRLVEDPDDRAEHGQVDLRRARQQPGHLVGTRDRVVLGVELTEEHLDEGGEQQRQDAADRDRDSHREAAAFHHLAEGRSDQRLGDVTHEQSGHGDAQLRARKHERGALGDLQGALRALVPGGCPSSQLGTVDRHVGEFLRDEVCGDCGDEQHDHDSGQQRERDAHRRASTG